MVGAPERIMNRKNPAIKIHVPILCASRSNPDMLSTMLLLLCKHEIERATDLFIRGLE